MGGSGFAGQAVSHRILRANKAFKLITTAVSMRMEGGGGKTLMERHPFSLLLRLCGGAWVRDRDRDRERGRGKYRTRVEPFPQKVRGVNTGEAHK